MPYHPNSTSRRFYQQGTKVVDTRPEMLGPRLITEYELAAEDQAIALCDLLNALN